jgi:peroxisomal coenzyme A diphosphatase NUDT7
MNSKALIRLKSRCSDGQKVIGAQHLKRAAITVPLVLRDHEYHFLFEQRTPHIAQGGEICFPGGMFEDEREGTLSECAVRETCEELGIGRSSIEVLGESLGTAVSLRGIAVECFPALLTLNSLDDLKLDKKEVDRVFILPVSWFHKNKPQEYEVHVEMHPRIIDHQGTEKILFPAEELDLPDKYHNSWKVNAQRVIVYDTPEGVIWGMTASVIEEFLELLNGE